MTRAELEHAIRAACDVTGDTEVVVFGSQAILGQFPDAPAAVRVSVEVDIAPKHFSELVDAVDGALGELSPFHDQWGFYVHGLPIEAATLPPDWELRAVSIRNANTRYNTGWCVEAHDLAASKLVAFREKDRAFVSVLLAEEMVSAGELLKRIALLPISAVRRRELTVWVLAISQSGGLGPLQP